MLRRTRTSTLPDDLSCGPLRDFHELASWRADRLAFWAQVDNLLDGRRDTSEETGDRGAHEDLLGAPDRIATADDIVLWLGTGLREQLTLTWMRQVLRALHVDRDKLRLVQFYANARNIPVSCVAMLSPAEFASAPTARSLTDRELAYLDEVWSAVTSLEPEALLRLLSTEGPPFPLLDARYAGFSRVIPISPRD